MTAPAPVPEPDLRATGQRIEVLLEAVATAGPVARGRAEELVRLVVDLYGSGLERLLEIVHESGRLDDDLLDRLAADRRLHLDRSALDAAIGEPLSFVGTAPAQVQAFVDHVADVVGRHPEAAAYRPEPIL